MLEYGAQNKTPEQTVIKVLGIGGGGNNAVKQMIKTDVHGAEYYLINTEKQILERANTNKCKILQIGKELTNGMGAGADPQVGEKSARESQEEIEKILDGTDLLFLTAGMGGGTGTGAIPVIADIARKKGIMTIAVVTTPFSFEGKLRSIRAKMGIEKLKPNVNALIIINNDQLIESTDKNVSMVDAFKLTDDVLRQAVESITDLFYMKFTKCMKKNISYVVGIGIIAGIVSSSLGIGGGMITNPAFSSLGMDPKQSSSTSNFLIIITAIASSFIFILSGQLIIGYSICLGFFCTAAALIGSFYILKYINQTGRSSILLVIMEYFLIASLFIALYKIFTLDLKGHSFIGSLFVTNKFC